MSFNAEYEAYLDSLVMTADSREEVERDFGDINQRFFPFMFEVYPPAPENLFDLVD